MELTSGFGSGDCTKITIYRASTQRKTMSRIGRKHAGKRYYGGVRLSKGGQGDRLGAAIAILRRIHTAERPIRVFKQLTNGPMDVVAEVKAGKMRARIRAVGMKGRKARQYERAIIRGVRAGLVAGKIEVRPVDTVGIDVSVVRKVESGGVVSVISGLDVVGAGVGNVGRVLKGVAKKFMPDLRDAIVSSAGGKVCTCVLSDGKRTEKTRSTRAHCEAAARQFGLEWEWKCED